MSPGRLVIADEDGIVIAPRRSWRRCASGPSAIEAGRGRDSRGDPRRRSLIELTNLHEHVARLRAGEASRFEIGAAGVRWAFLPVLGAAVAHAPVLRFDLLPWLKRPLDGGRTLRGRRLLGDNKTWRGALVMSGGVIVANEVLQRVPAYRARLPEPLRGHGLGVALAAAVVGAELPNSFIKRQLDIAPGAQRSLVLSVIDQGDVVLGSWLTLLPLYRMSAREALDAFATFASVHLAVNAVGVALGARDTYL